MTPFEQLQILDCSCSKAAPWEWMLRLAGAEVDSGFAFATSAPAIHNREGQSCICWSEGSMCWASMFGPDCLASEPWDKTLYSERDMPLPIPLCNLQLLSQPWIITQVRITWGRLHYLLTTTKDTCHVSQYQLQSNLSPIKSQSSGHPAFPAGPDQRFGGDRWDQHTNSLQLSHYHRYLPFVPSYGQVLRYRARVNILQFSCETDFNFNLYTVSGPNSKSFWCGGI